MSNFSRVAFGKNINELRSKKGLSIKQLSKATGISSANIGRIERGEVVAKMDTVFKLADFFDVSIDFLCNREITKPNDNAKVSINSNAGLSHKEATFVKDITEYIIDKLNSIV